MPEPTEAEIRQRARELHDAECWEGCTLPVETHAGWRDYAIATLRLDEARA